MYSRVGLFDYKVIVISEVLDKYDEAKEKRNNISSNRGFITVKEGLRNPLRRNAKFEKYVIFIADIDNIIDRLPQPYREVIRKRYFQGDISTFMKDFGIRSKRDANKIIRKSVNIFYDALEKYRKAS